MSKLMSSQLSFEYDTLLRVILSDIPPIRKLKYIIQVIHGLKISFLDIIRLMSSEACAKLFLDYYRVDRNAFLYIFSLSISQLNPEDIDVNQCSNFFQKTTLENQELELNYNEVDTTLDSFMMQYILPLGLFHLHNNIDIFLLFKPNNEQVSQSQGHASQLQLNSFHQTYYRFYLLDQIHLFLEKMYRKDSEQNIQRIFQRLKKELLDNIDWQELTIQMGPQQSRREHYNYLSQCDNHDLLLTDFQVVSHKLMRSTKKSIFTFLQNKKVGLQMLDNFEKTLDRASVARAFTIIIMKQYSCYEISGLLQNFYEFLENSKSEAMALKFAIMLIRCFDVLLKDIKDLPTSFSNGNQVKQEYVNSGKSQNSSCGNGNIGSKLLAASSLSCLLKGLLWKTVRLVLYVHKGQISGLVLAYLIRNVDSIFSGDKQMGFNSEIENYMYMIYSFLYVFHSNNNFIPDVSYLIKDSKDKANKLLLLLQQKRRVDVNFLRAHRFLELSYDQTELDERIQELFSQLRQLKGPSSNQNINSSINQQSKLILSSSQQLLLQNQQGSSQSQQITERIQAIEWLTSDTLDFRKMLPEQAVLVLAYIKKIMLVEYLESPEIFTIKKIGQSRELLGKLFEKLLQMPVLQDWQNITQSCLNGANTLALAKAQLLVECFGLIGAMPQDFLTKQLRQAQLSSSSVQQQYEIVNLSTEQFQRQDKPNDILEKIRIFLNRNLLSLDIPFNAICSCYENLEILKNKTRVNTQNLAQSAQSRQNLNIIKEELLENFTLTDFLVYLAGLAIKCQSQTTQDFKLVINASLDLLSSSDFAIIITPWCKIFISFLKQIILISASDQIIVITNDIYELLQLIIQKGHIFHKFIISQTLKVLDIWLFAAQKVSATATTLLNNKQKNPSNIDDDQMAINQDKNNNEVFIRNYQHLVSLIKTSDLCQMYIMLSEYQQAIYLLEKNISEQQRFEPENLKQPLIKQELTRVVQDLYQYYCYVNEDYKNIDGVAMQRRLDLDPAIISEWEKQKNSVVELEPELLKDTGTFQEESARAERLMFHNLCSGPPQLFRNSVSSNNSQGFNFNNSGDNQIYILLRSICWAVNTYIHMCEDTANQQMLAAQIRRAFQNLKKGLSVHLFNGQALYEAKFHYFVSIQATIALEQQFTIFEFLTKILEGNPPVASYGNIILKINGGQAPSSASLDQTNQFFILKLRSQYLNSNIGGKDSSSIQVQTNLFTLQRLLKDIENNCLKTQLKMLELFQQNYEQNHYLRVIYKYMISQLSNLSSVFDQIYSEVVYNLAVFNFKNKKYDSAQANLKCLQQLQFSKRMQVKNYYWLLKAKIQKKLFNYIKAIHTLEKIKGDRSQLYYQEARQKYVTYYSKCQQYAVKDVKDKFKQILERENIKNETIFFKYAKYLDQTYPQPNLIQYRNIIHYYLQAVLSGRKYIYQTLPRMIHLWLDLMQKPDLITCEQDRDHQRKLRQSMENVFCQNSSQIENYKLVLIIQQLISQIEHPDTLTVEKFIVPTLARIASKYPYQSVWWLLPLKCFDQQENTQSLKTDRAKQILDQVKKLNNESYNIITQSEQFYKSLLTFAQLQLGGNFNQTLKDEQLLSRQQFNILLPVRDQLTPYLPTASQQNNIIQNSQGSLFQEQHLQQPNNQQYQQFQVPQRSNSKQLIQKLQQPNNNPDESQSNELFELPRDYDPYQINRNQKIGGVQRYMMIHSIMPNFKVLDSKEKPKKIEIKYKYVDENDKDCYGTKYFLLKHEQKSDVRKEQRTSEFCNFLNNLLDGFKFAKERNIQMQTYAIIPLNNHVSLVEWVEDTTTIKSIIDNLWIEKKIKGSLKEINQIFGSQTKIFHPKVWKIIRYYPSVFQEYFFKQFKHSSNWINAKMQYQTSMAVWSCFCYIIGLGDRHCDNILIMQNSGQVLHIDFDCIFEKGKFLPVPEIMPFRLSKNIEFALGAFHSQGLFRYYMIELCKFFAKNYGNILVALESFICDPLLQNVVQQDKDIGISRIKDNISFSKFPCIEEGVERLIQQCKDPAGLREMYFGWMPHM